MTGAVIKTAAVSAGVGALVVLLSQVMERVADLTAPFLATDALGVLAQFPAVNPLAEVSQVVVRATPATLELASPTHRVGSVLLGVSALVTQVVEGVTLVALVLPPEGVPGVATVVLAVRAVPDVVVSLATHLTPPQQPRPRDSPGTDRTCGQVMLHFTVTI